MIPVRPAPEPGDFDARVRNKGLAAIAEMVGEGKAPNRPGPARKKIADAREAIPPDQFPPFWRDALPDMLDAYHRLCAYSALYIEHLMGNASVDHMIPKSKAWNQVYEWSNYRLACSRINSFKSDVDLALDPFEIGEGLFALEFTAFQVMVGPMASKDMIPRVEQTIRVLHLNDEECCKAREAYVVDYQQGEIFWSYLKRRAPFVAQELKRQQMLRPGDGD